MKVLNRNFRENPVEDEFPNLSSPPLHRFGTSVSGMKIGKIFGEKVFYLEAVT